MMGCLLDHFRERVTPEDFAGEQVCRVRVVGEADLLIPVARRMFPGAEIGEGPADAVVISMRGGPMRPRLRAVLSRTRHKLLVPSSDYVYRFGITRSHKAAVLALLDVLIVSPVLDTIILPLMALWISMTGLTRRPR